LPNKSDLESAFDSAIAQTRIRAETGMKTATGEDARRHLEKLREDLLGERENALATGSINREWLQKTVRWVADWAPDTDLTLIAALGRIARAAPTPRP
jgi:hypothetical protein